MTCRRRRRRYGLAIARSPHDPSAYLALVRVAQARGDARTALSAASGLVRVAPAELDAWIATANRLRAARSRRGSAQDRRAGRHPDFPTSHAPQLLLIRTLRDVGEYALALDGCRDVEQRFGASSEVLAERALLLGLSGRMDEALATLRTGIEENGDSPHLFATLASLEYQRGDDTAGAAATDRALQLDPEDPTPLRTRCEFLAASGAIGGRKSRLSRLSGAEARRSVGALHPRCRRGGGRPE